MIHSSSLTYLIAATLLTVGCDTASDEQNRANRAQAEANKTIATTATAADEKMKIAQAEADKKIAQAQANFQTMREEYRHATTVALVDVDKNIDVLDKKWKTQGGKAKADMGERMTRIRADREAFMAGYRSLETESATTWDQTKVRLDKAMGDLKDLVAKG